MNHQDTKAPRKHQEKQEKQEKKGKKEKKGMGVEWVLDLIRF